MHTFNTTTGSGPTVSSENGKNDWVMGADSQLENLRITPPQPIRTR
ncbi:MAG: hypothetical protein ACI8RZ_005422 [Myxococcota bacterium]|jgi:hypothetical protein